ncbi:MAG: type VI secretion system baseplate subunit TssK [Candidatus Krumholzibacteriia bacterium]
MSRHNRVVWQEGMFLGPQHFQQSDRALLGEVRFRQEATIPFGWGVRSLQIDTEALANGRLTLIEVDAVLPDGGLVRAPAVDPLPPSRLLGEAFGPDQTRLELFLATPEERAGIPLCRLPERAGAAETRQFGEIVQVLDENDPGKQVEILVSRLNLKLVFGGENLTGHVALKLAEIERAGDGRYVLARDYAPPSLTLAAAGPLTGIVRFLLETLVTKSAYLSEGTRQRGGGLVDFGTADVGHFWLLHTANSFVPLLAHHQRNPRGHPLPVYLTLAQLAGALCTFVVDRHPRDLPAYQHENLGPVFRELERTIRELLEKGIPQLVTAIPLAARDEWVLVGTCADERLFEPSVQWFLGVSGELPEARVRDEVPVQVIVGSPHNIDFLVRTATPGVVPVHVPVPPRNFPLKVGRTYFKLESRGEIWDTIVEGHSLAIYTGSHDLCGLTYELVVMQ